MARPAGLERGDDATCAGRARPCGRAASLAVLVLLLVMRAAAPLAAVAEEAARFEVTARRLAPPAPAISATVGAFGEGGDLLPGGDFEPVQFRTLLLAAEDATAGPHPSVAVARDRLSMFDTLRDGALAGAEVTVLRLVEGRFREVRQDRVAAGGLSISGWFGQQPQALDLSPDGGGTATIGLSRQERGGARRWYALRAYDAEGRLSPFSEPAEVTLPETVEKPPGGQPRARRGAASRAGGGMPPLDGDPFADPDPHAPPAPAGLRARVAPDGAAVTLEWAGDPSGRTAGVVLFRAHMPPGEMRGFYLPLAGEEAQPSGEAPPEGHGQAAAGDAARARDTAVRRGDLLLIRAELRDAARGRLLSDRVWNGKEARAFRPPLVTAWPDEPGAAPWALVPHEAQGDRAWGGKTFLRADLAGRQTLELGAYNHAGTGQSWYQVLRPGVPYRLSARLRGSRPGRALLRFEGPYAREVAPVRLDYGTGWQEVSAEFTLPRQLGPDDRPGRVVLTLTGPGQVDIDNLRLHRADTAFLDFPPEDYARLAQARLSALRTHGLIKTGQQSYDLADLLDQGGIALGGRQVPGLPETLRMMERAGVEPWLQIEPHLTGAEWRGLAEYLAAPFDPARDDPAALPWAALRVAQGRTAPWTDAFARIHLEIGNETWNPLFQPWVFPGLTDAATGERLSPGAVYGRYQAHVAEILRATPWWGPAGLEDKVDFVIGGRSGFGYGRDAALAAGDAADFLAVAAYNGGWDENEGPPAADDPASFANLLNQVSQTTIPRAAALAEDARAVTAARGAAGGAPLAFGTYEAGPGYALDGLNHAEVGEDQRDAQEQVMKSRAAGVATLDSFLAQRAAGMGLQNFFTFGEGALWKSHEPWFTGGEPYPSWALVTLLDAEAAGEMLAVTTEAVPVRDLRASKRREAVAGAPQIAVYATRADDRVTVIAISRQVPGYPRPGDSGCTPVEIALPFRAAQSLELIRTGGALADNPVSGPDPVIERRDLPVATALADGVLRIGAGTGAEACGLPGGSAYLYVFRGVAE